jgi:hypothetical protein
VWHPSCYIYQKCYRKGSIVTTTHVAYRWTHATKMFSNR